MTSRPIDHGPINHDGGHLQRLELFSDAVFAIAITLLAIELHPPEGWDRHVASFFVLMGPKLITFATSFAVIAVNWISHRRTFARMVRADGMLDVLNFVMLALVVLTPFATELLNDAFSWGAVAIYIGTVGGIGFAHGLIWCYAAFIGGLVDPRVPLANRIFILFAVGVTPAAMCALSFLAFSSHSLIGFAAMAIWITALVIAGRRLRRRAQALLAAQAA